MPAGLHIATRWSSPLYFRMRMTTGPRDMRRTGGDGDPTWNANQSRHMARTEQRGPCWEENYAETRDAGRRTQDAGRRTHALCGRAKDPMAHHALCTDA
ncbi:hypothetical protein SPI_03336 [Niveomyces insectorum RCEF 264]|uniref:Uncharacterized protein n=1 Tax=Niveomyces insectorum RCEF 264 TaxID=1081102 RepID=A0A167X9E1_9HYPO|nr:hypothetical protein SPI_03336 [Niveomyces insectorum RCEF 264]